MEQDDDVSKKPDFVKKTYPLPSPSVKAKLSNIILRTIIQQRYPLQVSLFWDKKIKKYIDDIINKEKPDYIIADFIRTTEYLKNANCYKIADLQDLLSLRYKRQLNADLKKINPYGAYYYRFPNFLRKLLNSTCIKKTVMKTEIRLLSKFERSVSNHYDRVMFVAKKEGQLYNEMTNSHKSLICPLGVDYLYFSESIDVEKEQYTIAFMGALNVSHNEYGIVHFIEKIFPSVLEKYPMAKLYIIGGGVTDLVKKYSSDNIIITGRVPDVRIAVKKCSVFICPLKFGSGIKTKNLEAMAMGMPVVTTSVGAENIYAEHEKDWLIADEDTDFADQICRLFANSNFSNSLSGNAQSFIKNNFTWESAKKAFESVLIEEN